MDTLSRCAILSLTDIETHRLPHKEATKIRVHSTLKILFNVVELFKKIRDGVVTQSV